MKSIIHTELAPSPIGPYSQAVKAGDTLYVSGQIAIHPETGELVQGNISDETTRVMLNIRTLLSASGLSFSDVVKTSIFLSDMKHFAEVNSVYGSYFDSDFPARETVAVLGLPKNVNVEISVTAHKA